jgi:hypothetical protein
MAVIKTIECPCFTRKVIFPYLMLSLLPSASLPLCPCFAGSLGLYVSVQLLGSNLFNS